MYMAFRRSARGRGDKTTVMNGAQCTVHCDLQGELFPEAKTNVIFINFDNTLANWLHQHITNVDKHNFKPICFCNLNNVCAVFLVI